MRSFTGAVAGVLAATLVLCGCSRGTRAAAQPTDAPLHMVDVRSGSVAPSLVLAGLIAPHQNVAISSALQEPADGVYVREGDRVAAGQVLARLDTADLRANYDAALRNAEDARSRIAQTRDQGVLAIQQSKGDLASAQSQLTQARQKMSLSQLTLQRDRQLYVQGFISRQTLDNDTTQYRSDEQAVESAQASVQTASASVNVNGDNSRGLQQENVTSARAAAASAQAQADQIAVQITKATIISPVDGVVINRNINSGQYPGSSQIFTIQEMNTVYAMLNASSDEVFRIHNGMEAAVSVPGLNARPMRGIVEAVLGQAQPGSTNFVVKVRVANAGGVLQSGMVVSARISLPAVAGPMIPTSAFVDASHDAVRTANADGTTRVVAVRDIADDGAYSIVDGLGPRTRVVLPVQ